MKRRVIKFRYDSRPWQREALEQLKAKKFSAVVAHRRAGKTELMVIRLLLAAMTIDRVHPAPFFGYVAPFLNQAKAVAWDRLKFYSRELPGVKINESELTIYLWNKAAIRLFGADYPDRLRGLGFDGIVMDEVAQMRPETWAAVVRPALVDRDGWAAFIGTPKGVNVFYDLYQSALGNPDWFAGFYPADQTGLIEEATLVQLRREMGEGLFRQEFLCDFTADNSDTFIDFNVVNEAVKRGKPLLNPSPLVLGVDVARFGDDRSVIVFRRGQVLEEVIVRRGQDLMKTASEVAGAINRTRPRAVFVDSVGLGAGVVDRLKQLGHKVIGVNSGARPVKPARFVNLKAEM